LSSQTPVRVARPEISAAPEMGNQARLRRLAALPAAGPAGGTGEGDGIIRRLVTAPSPADSKQVIGEINGFCPGAATLNATSIAAAPGACDAPASPGCECACSALKDTKRVFNVSPVDCAPKMTQEKMADGSTQTIPESTVTPNTLGPTCGSPIAIQIPKPGSGMEFGAFMADGKPLWYKNQPWRILAHELCGHGVGCQAYPHGQPGNRQEHDSTITTENTIAAPPVRGLFASKRQGESFMYDASNPSKVAFRQVDGWHYEAP
jgi:hypothetical protein